MQRFLNKLIPFILAGVAVVAFIFGIMLLAYLFLFGAILGFAFFLASWLHAKLFPPKTIVKPKEKSGRIIDSDDWKKL